MKKNITKKKFSLAAASLFAMAVAVSVLFYACKKPTDGINVLVDSQLLSPGATTVVFVNADSTSVNQPGDFTVTISGPGAGSVQMVSGGTTFKASHGMLPLSLVKGTNPAVTGPVTFTLTAQVPGFATTFVKTITINNTNPGLYILKGIDYSTSSPGTSLTTKTTGLTAGNLVSAYAFTTSTNAKMTDITTFNFQAGTLMRDANNNLISGSTLVANVVQLGASNNAITNDFPGGLFSTNALDKNGVAITGGVGFVPAGFLAISLTDDGTPVKNFSKPFTATVELANGFINFATGVAVKVGDVIPVWSLNDATGQWRYESDSAPVILDANNKLAVPMTITHLSDWMCGWFWSGGTAAGKAYGSCSTPFNAIITSPIPVTDLTIKMVTKTGSIIDSEKPVALGQSADGTYTYQYTFASSPAIGVNAELIAYAAGIALPIAVSSPFDPCSTGSITIPLSSAVLPSFTSAEIVKMRIQGICTGKQVSVLPTATFVLYQQTTATVNAFAGVFTLTNGNGATVLNVGSTYIMGTYYNGTYYQTNPFVVTAGAISIPAINGFLLTTTFDDATKTLSIDGTIPIPCN